MGAVVRSLLAILPIEPHHRSTSCAVQGAGKNQLIHVMPYMGLEGGVTFGEHGLLPPGYEANERLGVLQNAYSSDGAAEEQPPCSGRRVLSRSCPPNVLRTMDRTFGHRGRSPLIYLFSPIYRSICSPRSACSPRSICSGEGRRSACSPRPIFPFWGGGVLCLFFPIRCLAGKLNSS